MASNFESIPVVDIARLFVGASPACAAVDAAIGAACREVGFLIVTGQPDAARLDQARWSRLLALFEAPEAVRHAIALRKFNPDNPNHYRGYYFPQNRVRAYKEGIDIGRDPTSGAESHPLIEANLWPEEAVLPGWRAAALAYFAAVEAVGLTLLRAMARYLGQPAGWFDAAFRDGNSTLRLLRYPVRPRESMAGLEHDIYRAHLGRRLPLMTSEHTDSGCLTLLAQDGVEGLQVRNARGQWIDVPALAGSLVVNLGDFMQRWTGGALAATEHRVLGSGRLRHSVPFFLEPRVDAVIAPLPGRGDADVPPVVYGDYLLAKIERFPEFTGIGRAATGTETA